MDEDAGVKAPVTRLRRRISVEQTEEKSPAVNTPTKKRGGRRTAKPDLELIDENTPDNTTTKQTTKKTAAKDIIDAVEEKPITPSRRSTRIKSNTSIVSETAVAVNSPRAKRAARRTSQIGSDSEAPATPVRQTRRTRKDSTSSIEKGETQTITKPAIQITEVISEEPENNLRKSTSNAETSNSNSPTHLRKSPRLVEKNNKRNSIETEMESNNQVSDVPNKIKENTTSKESIESPTTNSQDSNTKKITQKERLSTSMSNLIDNLNTEAKLKLTNLNKSTTVIENKQNVKSQRVRTKSWTTNNTSNETNFYSDNESVKKKISKESKVPITQTYKIETIDILSTSLNQNKSMSNKEKKNSGSFLVEDIKNVSNKSVKENNDENDLPLSNNQSNIDKRENATKKLFEKEPSSVIQTMVYIEDDSDTNSAKLKLQNRHENEDQCVPVVKHHNQLEKEDSPIPLIPDKKETSYSNKSKSMVMNDSCEPMDVDETLPENLQTSQMNSEDMNSSEIKSSSVHQLDINEAGTEKLNKSKRKSSLSNTLNKTENENKSTLILSQLKDSSTGDMDNIKSPHIKNSILSKTVDDLNTTQDNDINKKNLSLTCVTTSTPLHQKRLQKLSNINTSIITSNDVKDTIQNTLNESNNKANKTKNDTSAHEENDNLNQSSHKKSETINKSASNKDESLIKKNITGTSATKNDIDSESGDESPENRKKKGKRNISNPKKSMSVTSDKDESDSNDEMDSNDEIESNNESQETSNMLDDEADDAGDDYESGDSQDEDERQYLKDNEILEKGETLSTEDELSNDSDYEKDSFIVSSDPEDNEFLEGTSDDLSMSDNELKMTGKSKKKYDERKMKEAKKASREMFESRHKLNIFNKSNTSEFGKTKKNKRRQLSSSESEEDVDNDTSALKSKKTNRMRLDSSHETSLLDKNESKNSKKKAKRLSESVCEENAINEKEITICNETLKENDPLATNVQVEPKTPQGNASIAFINSDNDPSNDSELTRTQTELVDPLDNAMDEGSLSSDNEIMQNYDSILEGLNKTSKSKSTVSDISLNIEKKKPKKEKTAIVDELNLTQVKSAKKTKTKKQNESIAKEKKVSKPDLNEGESSDSIDLHLLFSDYSSNSDDVQKKKNNISISNEKFIPLKKSEGKTDLRDNADKSKQAEISFNLTNKKHRETIIKTSSSDDMDNSDSIFIGTEGTNNKSINKSLNSSLKIKKTAFYDNDDDVDTDSKYEELQQEIKENITAVSENSDSDASMDIPFKKEKPTPVVQDNNDNDEDGTDLAVDESNTKTPASEKKKTNARVSQISEKIENEIIPNESMNISLSSAKKKKKKSISETLEIEQTDKDTEDERPSNKSVNKTPKSEKKKKQNSLSVDNDQMEEKECQSLNVSQLKTPGSQKKTKMSMGSQNIEQPVIPEVLNSLIIKTPGIQKKKSALNSLEQKDEEAGTDQNVTLGSTKKNKTHSNSITLESESITATVEPTNSDDRSTKKRKRKSSIVPVEEIIPKDDFNTSIKLNESLVGSQKKKRKISQNNDSVPAPVEPASEERNVPLLNFSTESKSKNEPGSSVVGKKNKTKKRKEREDDEGNNIVKIFKENSFDKIHVPRLPASILSHLDEKPKQVPTKKLKVVSTTNFSVEEAKKRKNKPSNYLEESIYINDDETESKKQKKRLQKPKVLPFVPTALTSASGYTTNFKVNIIPSVTKFVAQSNTVANFKDDYLFNKKIKRQGTYELYKRNRNIKISKF